MQWAQLHDELRRYATALLYLIHQFLTRGPSGNSLSSTQTLKGGRLDTPGMGAVLMFVVDSLRTILSSVCFIFKLQIIVFLADWTALQPAGHFYRLSC